MAFIKLDKATPEWVNLDHVSQVEVSGSVVRVVYLKAGVATTETVATGADAAEAALLAQQVIHQVSGEVDLT